MGNSGCQPPGNDKCFPGRQTARMSIFGDQLKQARDAKGWSQERVGFELDVTKATVSKWEIGRAHV